ncbi:MAG: hypothetical protein ACNJA3_28675 (plasmid) [Pseudomonas rhizophila]|uniref:hypothetical protein n=1 Tax=Pseudomonas rhizophila TaxID=2045200 RepID=UPI003F6D19DC
MIEEMKNLTRLLVLAPLFFISWCFFSYLVFGSVPDGNVRTAIMVTMLSIAIGALFAWIKRKALNNRVFLHIKPNTIEVESAEVFRGEFSSENRFLVNTEEFQKTLRAVVVRKSHVQGRFMFAKESAFVRIWPGVIGITELELEALTHALSEEFIEAEVEIVATDMGDSARDTAIKA